MSNPSGFSFANADAWRGKIFNGEWVTASGVLDVIEPASGQPLHQVGKATPEDVAIAVREARAAQRVWAATP